MEDISKKIEVSIKKNLRNELNRIVEETKRIIIEEYDDKLMGFKRDSKSKIDYNLYREEFISRLNEFQFIEET